MARDPMISFAQNCEDVVLRRLFPNKTGLYVDVGAAYPSVDSVTKYFYDQGWSGINIEPQPELYKFLQKSRPRDININAAVSPRAVSETLTTFDDGWGLATIEPAIATKEAANGRKGKQIQVPTIQLDSILEQHRISEIDFLKIDVEGAEAAVLSTINLKRWMPTVIVIELTNPEDWEHLLAAQGYKLVYFDGLNRFYLSPKDTKLEKYFSTPANIFDRFVPFLWWHQAGKKNQEQWVRIMRAQGNKTDSFKRYFVEKKELNKEFRHAMERVC